MQLADFDFDLPPDRIAQEPARPRDAARLLRVGETLSDHIIADLPQLLRAGDLLVVNDTKVIPGQLTGYRGGAQGSARIGITLDQPRPDGAWHALARNARRLKAGDRIVFEAGLEADVEARDDDGGVSLRFNLQGKAFDDALALAGALALPPYIERPDGLRPQDHDDYQTMFARESGAVAAPTAGLHFTAELLQRLQQAGIGLARLTLHVGAGTFLPVRDDNVQAHRMHAERGAITVDTANAINATRAAGGRVVAVGTTSLRMLESAARDGQVVPFQGDTELFILPGFTFHIVDALITNFHLPKSTLFMLTCAFAGHARMRNAYAHALQNDYRFYSYGDASLLERAP